METVILTGRLRTEAGWHTARVDLGKYLQIGDRVDETMKMYFLEVLPPACWESDLIQIGEPASCNARGDTFATLQRYSSGSGTYPATWVYTGERNLRERVSLQRAA